MPDLEIPHGIRSLSAGWFTQALRRTKTIGDATVTSFDAVQIAQGEGFLGELARVALRYDHLEPGAPRSLIAKFPIDAPENREIARTFRFYEVETSFYREVAGDVELRTPRCYYNAFDPATHDFVLLLEDLAPARVGNQLAGCTAKQVELSVAELAKFHAAWWQHPRLPELAWLPGQNDAALMQAAEESYAAAWDPFVREFGGLVPPEILRLGERFGGRMQRLTDNFAQEPATIVHGDFRLDNLFFATPEGGDPLAVIDWQLSSRGRGVFDIAYFVAGSLEPVDRKAREMTLLRMYHDTLTRFGVRDYDFEQCFADYRLCILFLLAYSVIESALDTANERGLQLLTTILTRTAAAIGDLDAGELLPD
jgi:hypothetical protein